MPDIQVSTHHNRLFLEPPTFGGKHINLQSKKKFCSTHDSVVTFLDVVGKLTVTVTVRLFRDNANNQKYVIV